MSKNKLYLIISALVTLCATIIGTPVYAAEITPNPASYSYGSTSEVAPSVQIQTSSSSSTLAPTGESTVIILAAAFVLIGGGIVILVVSRKKFKKH